MKEWTLTTRILLAVFAYFLSLLLFVNTSAFEYDNFKTSFITVNVIAAIIIGLGYVTSKNALSPNFFVCMGLCVPSLMAYSKLGKSIFEINVENNFNAYFTAVLYTIVILMLLAAAKLKRLEKEYDTLVSDGADEEDVKQITTNGLKVYSAFIAGVFGITFVAETVGVTFLKVEGSTYTAIITAIAGIILFSGCVYFLSRKWTNQSHK
ncbi:MAG: hypothetical protein BWY74_04428 [Firmicutes bacterium ADurb.Bin419]|nr:MAG: hypothetical protein BWY74_04428 [Firmicutes bacterium ADurb.Bin419]